MALNKQRGWEDLSLKQIHTITAKLKKITFVSHSFTTHTLLCKKCHSAGNIHPKTEKKAKNN